MSLTDEELQQKRIPMVICLPKNGEMFFYLMAFPPTCAFLQMLPAMLPNGIVFYLFFLSLKKHHFDVI